MNNKFDGKSIKKADYLITSAKRSSLRTPVRTRNIGLKTSGTSSAKKKCSLDTPDKAKSKIKNVAPALNNKDDSSNVNICVAIRARPLTKKEIFDGDKYVLYVDRNEIFVEDSDCAVSGASQGFRFNHVFWHEQLENGLYGSQENIFNEIASPLLDASLEGYNVCLFAYGQTGSGKTYSMMGADAAISGDEAGITPRFGNELMKRKSKLLDSSQIHISISYYEIYNEKIHDLLVDSSSHCKEQLRVREHPERGPYIENLTTHNVDSSELFLSWIVSGNSRRATAATCHNDRSSRSHAILDISILKSSNLQSTRSKISLVDLAGSERSSFAPGNDRFKESLSINKSLLTLGKVITALSDTRSRNFVPYRDSVLTWLLRKSLGGDSKTVMLATVSPNKSALDETLATLRWANKASHIVCSPKRQEDPRMKLISDLRSEIEELKSLKQNFFKINTNNLTVSELHNKIDINEHMKILENQQQLAEEKLRSELEKLEVDFQNSEKMRAQLQIQNEILLNGITSNNVSPYQTDYFKHLKNTLDTSFSHFTNDSIDLGAEKQKDMYIEVEDSNEIATSIIQLQNSTLSLQRYIQLYNMGDRASILINIVQKSVAELTDIINSHIH